MGFIISVVVVTALARTPKAYQSFPCKSVKKTAQKTVEHSPCVWHWFQILPLGNEDSMSITDPISEICRSYNFLVSGSSIVSHSSFSSLVFTPLPSSIVESIFQEFVSPWSCVEYCLERIVEFRCSLPPRLSSHSPCQHHFLLCIPASEVQRKMLMFFMLSSCLPCILAVS